MDRRENANQLINLFILVCFSISTSVVLMYFMKNTANSNKTRMYCWKSFNEDDSIICRPLCKNGSFSFSGMNYCKAWLGCKDIANEVLVKELLLKGNVKKVYLAEWNGYRVVMSNLTSPLLESDFQHNIKMLKAFGSNSLIVQLLGYCNNTIITEYHSLGSALNVNFLLNKNLVKYNTVSTRLKLCISYAQILAYLHNSPVGIRVMCDSSSLQKTLSQYLLRDDFHLILNDLDALPEVHYERNLSIKCGHAQLTGDFVAPEQLWPYSNREFNDDDMPLYNEKSDIWKIPDVCNWFLGNVQDDIIKFKLFKIHNQCKEIVPSLRPTAASVLKIYTDIWKKMFEEE